MLSLNNLSKLKKRKLLSVFILNLLTLSLTAGPLDHLKPASNKSDNHHMRNIDFIYMINLDQRPEKFTSCKEQLEPYDIHPYRFSAVNGWELTFDTINDVGVHYEPWMSKNLWGTFYLPEHKRELSHEVMQVTGRTYFCHCLSRGAIGIALSHLSILKDAYDSGYKTIWVMEDDIQLIRNPHEISDLIDRLDALVGKEGWDILFTDQDTKNQQGGYVTCSGYAQRPNYTPSNPSRFSNKSPLNSEFRVIGSRYGSYSMIIKRSAMKKLLDFFHQYNLFLPYDMEYYLPNDIRMITVLQDVVSTEPQAISDNGGANYKNKSDSIEDAI